MQRRHKYVGLNASVFGPTRKINGIIQLLENNSLYLFPMKNMLLTFIAILYLGTSSGFAMHFHYCKDELIETSFFHNDVDKCSNCGMEKKVAVENGCCKDEYKELKVDKAHDLKEIALQFMHAISIALPPIVFEISSFLQLANFTVDQPLVNLHPKDIDVPVYLRNCVFRI